VRLNRDLLAIVSQVMFMRTVAVMILSLPITACVPWPHRGYFAPEIEGVLLDNGVPVTNVKLKLSADFTDRQQIAITDADGRFVLRPISEWRLMAPLIGDPLYGYTLEVDMGDRKFPVYSNGGVGYAESRLELRCDLPGDVGAIKQPQFCTAVWSHR
jgi:hypothetical protein